MQKEIKWNPEKARLLRECRNIDLSKVAMLIREDRFRMEMVPSQENHSGQRMFIVKLDGYTCCVPFVKMDNGDIFIKTAFQSRVYHKKYKDLLK